MSEGEIAVVGLALIGGALMLLALRHEPSWDYHNRPFVAYVVGYAMLFASALLLTVVR